MVPTLHCDLELKFAAATEIPKKRDCPSETPHAKDSALERGLWPTRRLFQQKLCRNKPRFDDTILLPWNHLRSNNIRLRKTSSTMNTNRICLQRPTNSEITKGHTVFPERTDTCCL